MKKHGARSAAGNGDWMGEDWRQAVHVLFGACVMVAFVLLGKTLTILGLLAMLCVAVLFISRSMLGRKNPLFDLLLEKFERRVVMPGKGAFMYVVGALFLLTFSRSPEFALAALGILAFGDGVSTMVGLRGKRKLAWNPKKTVEGTAAFIAAGAIVSFPLIGLVGVVYSVLLALVETLPLELDDNLLIPVAAVLLNLVIK
ncbi:MAG: hypothetical protein NTY90_01400 [Candidatus Micrarchaeota archaeon]|nr:hypothetical protein [Candidatus Micrarchaeota archaeon]